MLTILASSLLLALAQASPPAGYSWTQNPGNGHYYALTAPMRWHEAAAEADWLGPDVEIVTVRDLSEQTWLWTNIANQAQAWIGYSDLQQDGTWVWRSGELTPFWEQNGYFGQLGVPGYWLSTQPDGGSFEYYAHFSTQGRWNDASSELNPAILEWYPQILTADYYEISAGVGGVVRYSINFPSSDAGTKYKFLGSATGLGPTTIGGIQVPLSAGDWLWDSMLAFPGPGVFQSANGRLDANGDALVSLTLPPGAAVSLVGSTLYFAAVLYIPSTFTGIKSSSAVPLTILL